MERSIRDAQLKLLDSFAGAAGTFALAGGTALELFYLKHRFSRDLDFFSARYKVPEIDALVRRLSRAMGLSFKMESELTASGRARVRFYTAKIKGASPLKIDFVEDVIFKKPVITKFARVPVYSAKSIYLQKIIALTGSFSITDSTGRELPAGRNEVRDVVDVYYLSKKIEPLSRFLKTIDRKYQRSIVHWYRSYSRQDVKFGILDLDLYDKKFDASGMISYLDSEIMKFIGDEIK